MKLYHYVKRPNNVLEKGLLSIAMNKNTDLSYYLKRSGAKTHDEVCQWMESTFEGRSRGIRAFTEPCQWTERSLYCIKSFVDQADLFEINIEAMDKDGLIEAVYISPSVLDLPNVNEEQCIDEILQKIKGIKEIDCSPIDWNVCDDELGHRFAFVRYYLLVVQNGVIPPKYLKKI
ncbi:MAG: hypothetical protein IJ870_07120 [Alphaproteobacteria bacterium]|nr:hypothetical protein [Alphaproteobacteria bacterium]